MKKFLILSVSLLATDFVSAGDSGDLIPIAYNGNLYLTNYNRDTDGKYVDGYFKLDKECHTDCQANLCPWHMQSLELLPQCDPSNKSITYAEIPPDIPVKCKLGLNKGVEIRPSVKIYDCIQQNGEVLSFN